MILRLGLRLLCLCLRQARPHIGRIDLYKQLTFANKLVVVDRDAQHPPGDLRRKMHDVRVDEGVVGVFVLPRVQPPDQAADQKQDQNRDAAIFDPRVREETLLPFVVLFVVVLFLLTTRRAVLGPAIQRVGGLRRFCPF